MVNEEVKILGVLIAGIFAIISSVFLGHFGLAVIAFTGLLACSTVLVLLVPFIIRSNSN